MGVGRGAFWNLTFPHQIISKKDRFLSFEWLKWNFGTLASPCKIFLATPGKSTIGPSLEKNPSDALVSGNNFSLSTGWEKRESSVWVHYCSVCESTDCLRWWSLTPMVMWKIWLWNHHLFTDDTVWCVLRLVQPSVAFNTSWIFAAIMLVNIKFILTVTR